MLNAPVGYSLVPEIWIDPSRSSPHPRPGSFSVWGEEMES